MKYLLEGFAIAPNVLVKAFPIDFSMLMVATFLRLIYMHSCIKIAVSRKSQANFASRLGREMMELKFHLLLAQNCFSCLVYQSSANMQYGHLISIINNA